MWKERRKNSWSHLFFLPNYLLPTQASVSLHFTAVRFLFRQEYILIWAIAGNSVDVVELLHILTKVTKLRRNINIYFVFLFCLFFSSVPSLSVLYSCIAASSLHFRGIFPKVPVPWNSVFFKRQKWLCGLTLEYLRDFYWTYHVNVDRISRRQIEALLF